MGSCEGLDIHGASGFYGSLQSSYPGSYKELQAFMS